MRKFFVTGGAGFIGSAFVRLLLDESPLCEVTNFDALTYAGNPDNLKGLDGGRHYFIKGDICDRERSEEHTSELQSQSNLVCRLLLEKKKKTLYARVYTQSPTHPVRHR